MLQNPEIHALDQQRTARLPHWSAEFVSSVRQPQPAKLLEKMRHNPFDDAHPHRIYLSPPYLQEQSPLLPRAIAVHDLLTPPIEHPVLFLRTY
ncbi:hypothetical protein D3C71_1586680 [compost metagenome]